MPEYPDVELYLHALRNHICGRRLIRVSVKSPFLMRTFDPDICEVEGAVINLVSRIGKKIVWHLEGEFLLVFHLMITGRFHLRKPATLPRSNTDLAAFQFDELTVMLTEAGKKKRASLHVLRDGSDALKQFDRGGLDLFQCSLQEFSDRLKQKNRTLKLALIDPAAFDGIGNAYSDEILHAARLSPFARTAKLAEPQIACLLESIRQVLAEWKDRLISQAGGNFPEKVTAFRPEMAVHGKFGDPCPVCGKIVQRIRFSEREWNYCAECQTGGKLLADRSLSRLLKDEWPSHINDLK